MKLPAKRKTPSKAVESFFRLTAALLAAFLCLTAAACGAKQPSAQDIQGFLIEKSIHNTVLMGKLAGSPEYTNAMSYKSSMQDMFSDLAKKDYQTPQGAVIVTLEKDFLEKAVDSLAGISGLSLPQDEEIRRQIMNRLSESAASLLNGRQGAGWLAAASILITKDTYSLPAGMKDLTYVVLLYPDDICSLVTFTPGEAGFVNVSASFVPAKGFLAGDFTQEKAESLLQEYLPGALDSAFPGFTILQLSQEELEAYSTPV